jgi:hypothetical protein
VVVNAEQSGGGWVPFVMHRVCDGCASNSITAATLTAFADWLAARAGLGTVVETVGQVLDGIPPPPPPAPSIAAILPASALAGSADLTVTITGANFMNASTVRWNGSDRQTVFQSATKLSAVISASDLASPAAAQVTVFNPAPGGGSSAAGAFTVAPRIPSISSISPVSALAGSADLTLTLNGTNFMGLSTVLWSGAPLPTVVVSSAQLTALIPAGDLAAPATAQVTVLNPGSGSSSAGVFAVGPRVPSIVAMSPASAMAGSAGLTLTIDGTNFTSSSTVLWAGAALQTVAVSSAQLTAVIPASDLAAPTTAQVTVLNPGSGGGFTSAEFAVAARSSASDPGGLRIFPNPWRAALHRGIAVTIDGLPAGSEVRLFTVSGRWVRTIGESGGKGSWDLTDASGRSVASGLYVYLITGGGLQEHGTLAVVQ